VLKARANNCTDQDYKVSVVLFNYSVRPHLLGTYSNSWGDFKDLRERWRGGSGDCEEGERVIVSGASAAGLLAVCAARGACVEGAALEVSSPPLACEQLSIARFCLLVLRDSAYCVIQVLGDSSPSSGSSVLRDCTYWY